MNDTQRSPETDLFGEGWLTDQLDRVTAELAGRAPADLPRLTGARAAAMVDPAGVESS